MNGRKIIRYPCALSAETEYNNEQMDRQDSLALWILNMGFLELAPSLECKDVHRCIIYVRRINRRPEKQFDHYVNDNWSPWTPWHKYHKSCFSHLSMYCRVNIWAIYVDSVCLTNLKMNEFQIAVYRTGITAANKNIIYIEQILLE